MTEEKNDSQDQPKKEAPSEMDNDAGEADEQSSETSDSSGLPVEVKGNLVFTDEALLAIAQHAIDQTDGIGIVARHPTGILSRFTRQKTTTPQLKMRTKTTENVTFDIDVWVNYGMAVTEVCEQLQQSVSDELQRIAGMVGIVNIRVRGLV